MRNALLTLETDWIGDTPRSGRPPAECGTPTSLTHEALRTAAVGLLMIAFCTGLVLHDQRFFWHDDYQSYQLAGFRDMARCWKDGEFPLLSPYSWNSGALAGEYQYGVFSVFLTICVLIVFGLELPLPLAAAALSIIHLTVLATGAFRLGRRRGLPVDLALLVALIASLNGWIIVWGAKAWFPALASFAWLPWLWWALDRALDGSRSAARAVPAGFFVYLVIAAGWPFTVLMAGALTLWFSVRVRAEHGRWQPAWPVAAAWAIGLGLSAPAWLMLVEYTHFTARGHISSFHVDPCWMIQGLSLPGLVFPGLVTPWNVFGTLKLHRCVELAGGLIPLAALLCVACHSGRAVYRRYRWELALCLLTLTLTLLPGLGNFRWSFRWLPFFFLVAGVLAAHALAELRAHQGATANEQLRPNPGRWATFLVLLVWSFALILGTDPTNHTLWQGAALLFICLLWAVVEGRAQPSLTVRPWMPSLVMLAMAALTFVPIDRSLEVPSWELDGVAKQPPFDPTVTYLSAYTRSDIFALHSERPLRSANGAGAELLPGNFGKYVGLKVVNGYSPMKPLGLAEVIGFGTHGFLGCDTALLHTDPANDPGMEIGRRLLIQESGPGGLLEQMGVHGLILPDRFAAKIVDLEANGWHLVGSVTGGQVLHRKDSSDQKVRAIERVTQVDNRITATKLVRERPASAAPWVLLAPDACGEPETLAFAPAQVTMRHESRTTVVAEVVSRSLDRESLVVFARPWYPGYRAEFNGQPVAVEVVNLILPAVRLPPGATGHVTLSYRPKSLVLGCALAAAASLAVVVLLVLAVWQRPGRGAVDD